MSSFKSLFIDRLSCKSTYKCIFGSVFLVLIMYLLLTILNYFFL